MRRRTWILNSFLALCESGSFEIKFIIKTSPPSLKSFLLCIFIDNLLTMQNIYKNSRLYCKICLNQSYSRQTDKEMSFWILAKVSFRLTTKIGELSHTLKYAYDYISPFIAICTFRLVIVFKIFTVLFLLVQMR